MPKPVARAAITWSHLLVIVALLAASLMAMDVRPADATSLKAPSGLAVSAKTSTTLTMQWRPRAKAAVYRLQYSTSSHMTKSKYQSGVSSPSIISGLKPAKSYYVRVRAISSSGKNLSNYSHSVKIKTVGKDPAPSAPSATPTVAPSPTPTAVPSPSPSTPTPTVVPSPTPAPTATACPSPTVPTTRLNLPVQPTVLLIGDSWSEGVGAVPLTNGYAYKIAAPLGWTLTRDAKWGSGYVNPTTYGGGIFADRLSLHPVDSFDLVVIQGSSNDMKYGSPELEANLITALGVVRERYPRAQVLMVGPTSAYGSPSADLVRVNDRVKAAATSCGAAFIDPIAERWFIPGDGAWAANPDNGHPSNAGHQVIADRFVAAVHSLS